MPTLAFTDNAWPAFGYNQTSAHPRLRRRARAVGYYASVSFTDYNVGMILDVVDKLALADKTVVIFTGGDSHERS